MKAGRIPPPDFDQSRYERPQKDWVCGHACEGCPCRVGPSPSGECRATTECKPVLSLPEGAPEGTKGTWKCTRPREAGGGCENGPNPDGSCCLDIPRCRPARSLRNRRGFWTRTLLALTTAFILIAFAGPWRDEIILPAPISFHHTGLKFVEKSNDIAKPGCASCHEESEADPGQALASAFQAHQTSLPWHRIMAGAPRDFSRMDQSCLACHETRNFHAANVETNTSCSVCHHEHQGEGFLPPVASSNCVSCHSDDSKMSAAAVKTGETPKDVFQKLVALGVVAHPQNHPFTGFTRLISSFSVDHPEFQVLRERQKDATVIRFNHQLHLSGTAASIAADEGLVISADVVAKKIAQSTIPLVDGKALDCLFCHTPDASGAFMQKVSFERNCRLCHSLDFDENTPGLQLPHGNSEAVRTFLRSLPTNYADHAKRKLGLSREEELASYVRQRMGDLRARVTSGENLEHTVFFANAPSDRLAPGDKEAGARRARFAGCTFCHEVTAKGDLTPAITPPNIPDRWMLHTRFNHAKHTAYGCTDCHGAITSSQTSDVILPNKVSCAICHSPQGGVSESCTTCHGYHNPEPAGLMPIPTTPK